MTGVEKGPLPDDALLARYEREGAYTDCYFTDLGRAVTHADYVEAFYTTWLFKLERGILDRIGSLPSTDDGAQRVARGEVDAFAAWTVEDRGEDQLLMCDVHGRTRSWLMVEALAGGSPGTRLYFGSAVVPVRACGGHRGPHGFLFRALLPFHKLYSRALLHAARSALD